MCKTLNALLVNRLHRIVALIFSRPHFSSGRAYVTICRLSVFCLSVRRRWLY